MQDMKKGRDRDDLDLPFLKDNPCRPINKASINF